MAFRYLEVLQFIRSSSRTICLAIEIGYSKNPLVLLAYSGDVLEFLMQSNERGILGEPINA